MPVLAAQVTVPSATAAVPLILPGTFNNTSGGNGDELPVIICNHDATNPVYLGGPGVTSSTGLKLAAGGLMSFAFIGTDALSLFARATGAPVVVGVLAGRQ